jgi:hypothetical protein
MAKIIKITPSQFAKTQAQRYDNLAASFEQMDQQFPGQGYDQLALQKRLQAVEERSKASQDSVPLSPTGSSSVFSSGGSGSGGSGGSGFGGGSANSNNSDSCGGGQRKIPCPFCTGQVLATQNGKGSSSQTLFPRLQNFLTAVSDLISVLTMGQKTVSRRAALGGKCETCGNSGSIKDPTDRKSQERAAAQILKSNAAKIRELETKLGHSPGGSMLERIAGAKVTIVGRTLNNAKSVTVLKGKAAYPESQVVKKAVPTTKGPKKGEGTNQIVGNNPPANTGGGLYYIQCGNKFKMTTGAQGIEMMSYGPISIDGTQVRISGAEITLGTNGGPTVVEGDHLQLNGKSIALTPSGNAGEVVIQGSASCSGNFKAGGAYVENLYAASITCPSSQTSTKVAAGTTDYVTGPAKWGGSSSSFPKLAIQNLLKWVMDSTTDFNMLGGMPPINPRSILKTIDNMSNMIYSVIPIETSPTGLCITAVGIGLVYNYPHSHALPDAAHSHDVTVPAISHDGNSSADVVRQKFDAGGGNSKAPVGPTENGNPLVKLVGGVIGGIKTAASAFSALVFPYTD